MNDDHTLARLIVLFIICQHYPRYWRRTYDIGINLFSDNIVDRTLTGSDDIIPHPSDPSYCWMKLCVLFIAWTNWPVLVVLFWLFGYDCSLLLLCVEKDLLFWRAAVDYDYSHYYELTFGEGPTWTIVCGYWARLINDDRQADDYCEFYCCDYDMYWQTAIPLSIIIILQTNPNLLPHLLTVRQTYWDYCY